MACDVRAKKKFLCKFNKCNAKNCAKMLEFQS